MGQTSSPTPFSICFLAFMVTFFSLCPTSSARSDNQTSLLIRLPSELADEDNQRHCAGVNPGSCPVTCFRTDPVCGVNGVTYWCGCADALCAGTKVAKKGFCEVGNGGSAPLSGQALLLVHIVWLIVLGFSVLLGLF